MTTDSLPEQWLRTSLGDVTPYGKTVKAEPSEISDGTWVLELEDIEKETSKILARHYFAERKSKSTKNSFKKGDVLYGKLRPYLNKVVQADQEGVCSTEIVPLDGGRFVENRYLFHWLKHPEFLAYVTRVGYGVNMPRLGTKDGVAAPFVLAPHAEQKQIATKLDELLAQVDSIKTRLDAIPAILKRFRQSVLAAAVSGRLTEDWRDANGGDLLELDGLLNYVASRRKEIGFRAPKKLEGDIESPAFMVPASWKWVRLGEIALKITDGAHNTPEVLESGYPYLMAKDLTGGKLDFSEKRYISEKDHRELHNKCHPEFGDLLVVNIGAGTGNNVSIDVDFEFSFKNIAIIKRPEFIEPWYLKWFFDARKEAIFSEQARGGAQPFLSLTLLNNLEFALPPLEEQNEIVRRVRKLFAFIDLLDQQLLDAQSRISHLTQSILAKGFRGELTAEWREQNHELITGENSAEALLERIKAASALVKPAKRARRKASA